MKTDRGLWNNCPGTESIHLVSDMICKSPDDRKNQPINETGTRFYVKNDMAILCDTFLKKMSYPI